jgi:hypothetical protein
MAADEGYPPSHGPLAKSRPVQTQGSGTEELGARRGHFARGKVGKVPPAVRRAQATISLTTRPCTSVSR